MVEAAGLASAPHTHKLPFKHALSRARTFSSYFFSGGLNLLLSSSFLVLLPGDLSQRFLLIFRLTTLLTTTVLTPDA